MGGDTARRFEFKAGQRIFGEGDPADYCYQVFRGKVQIVLPSSGRAEPIATIGPGEVFGEMGIIDDGPRSATAVAVEDSMCIGYTAASLLEQIERDPSTTVEIMKTLIRRLRDSNQRFSGLDAQRALPDDSRKSAGGVWGWISRLVSSGRREAGSR
jgi:CRP-like cAMP-binding protein